MSIDNQHVKAGRAAGAHRPAQLPGAAEPAGCRGRCAQCRPAGRREPDHPAAGRGRAGPRAAGRAPRPMRKFARDQADRYKALRDQGAETDERYAQAVNERNQDGRRGAGRRGQRARSPSASSRRCAARCDRPARSWPPRQGAANTAQLNLDDTLVRASIDGRIGDKTAQVGPVRAARHAADVGGAGAGRLSGRQLQGDPGPAHAGRPEGDGEGRCPRRRGDPRRRRELRARAPGAQFALLPPENATGNFIKIVQRVPVRIKLTAVEGSRGAPAARPVGQRRQSIRAATVTSHEPGGQAAHAEANATTQDWIAVIRRRAGRADRHARHLHRQLRAAADPGRDRRHRHRGHLDRHRLPGERSGDDSAHRLADAHARHAHAAAHLRGRCSRSSRSCAAPATTLRP